MIKTFNSTEPSSLISIKCNPYNYNDKVLIIGDAAHAMVPFYGQGMNCGFEDVAVLNELLDNFDLSTAIMKFSQKRVQDGHAICDLAMYNYIEMRDLVNSRLFLVRKKFDNYVNTLLPNYWIPLYSMVTFSRIPYSKCVQNRRRQDQIVTNSLLFLLSSIILIVLGRFFM